MFTAVSPAGIRNSITALHDWRPYGLADSDKEYI